MAELVTGCETCLLRVTARHADYRRKHFQIKEGTILSLILHLQKGQLCVSILPNRRICATCWHLVRYVNADHRTHICGSSVQWLEEVGKKNIVIRRMTKQERIRQIF